MRVTVAALLFAAVCLGPALASAQGAEELLAEGWRLYSEDLDFEGAAAVFDQVASLADATEAQKLEALEYLAACRYALGDLEAAREAIRRLLEIDASQTLHDPSHPPDLLRLVDEVRAAMPPAEEAGEGTEDVTEPGPDEYPESLPDEEGAVDEEVPPDAGQGEGETAGTLEEEYREPPRRQWFRTWWFWTAVGVVVAAGVTTAVVLSVPSGETEPPSGNLDPGVVQLPCTGLRF